MGERGPERKEDGLIASCFPSAARGTARRSVVVASEAGAPAYFSFDPPEFVAVPPDPHFPLPPSRLSRFPIRDMSLLASPAAQFATEEGGNPSSIKSFVAIHPTS